MKVKELIKILKAHDQEADVLVSSDEELNMLFEGVEVAKLDGEKKSTVVFFGLSGTEREEEY